MPANFTTLPHFSVSLAMNLAKSNLAIRFLTAVVAGPAIVESATTTVLLRPGDRATVTPQGWLDIAVPSSAAA